MDEDGGTASGRAPGEIDWRRWHAGYDDPGSALSRRLEIVRSHIAAALDRLPPGRWQVVSLCAGDGRDLLGVLERHPRRRDVGGVLVELDPELSAAGRLAYAAAGVHGVELRTGDAADPAHYRGLAADLLLVCGVFGNLTDAGVLALVDRLPALCRPGCTVVWTRHQRPPDLTPAIRAALGRAGFEELAFEPLETSWGCVGAARWRGDVAPPLGDRPLFEFVADVDQEWQAEPPLRP